MKTYLLSLALVFFAAVGFCETNPTYSVSPKPININEMVSKMDYPITTKTKAIEGKVLMLVNIDEEGNVIGSTALSYPCADLKDAVTAALKDLKFEPAKDKNGLAVASAIRMPFDFELTID